MGYEPHWLGIFTEDHTSWISVDGPVIPGNLLLWQENEPNDAFDQEDYVMNGLDGKWGLNDAKEESKNSFICDMIT